MLASRLNVLLQVALAACVLELTSADEHCASVDLAAWTSVRPFRGYHVLCFDSTCTQKDGDDSCSADGSVKVAAWKDGDRTKKEVLSMKMPSTLLELEELLIKTFTSANPTRHERIKKAISAKKTFKGLFAFFTVSEANEPPARVQDVDGLRGTVLVYEGGTFIWPGIEIGFQRNVSLLQGSSDALGLQLITRSMQPMVVEVSSFLQESECTHVIKKASPHIKSSPVSHMDHDVGKPDTNWRSSSQWFMPSDDVITKRLDARVAALTNVKVKHQEYSQVLRYEKEQRYAAHHDFFDPKMYVNNQDIQKLTKKGLFNRMATVFFYLSDVEEGGQTSFPRAGGLSQPRDFEDCSRGISIEPQQGRIIIFYSMDASGTTDEYSLHGGCAVKKGTKWPVNKWIWNKPMDYIS